MVSLSSFSKFAASAKNAMSSREATTIINNLKTIDASVQKLIEVVNGYTGGLLAANAISNQEAALGIDIKNAITDASNQGVTGDEESEEALTYIEGTLQPHIVESLKALQSKKKELTDAGLQGTVQGDLKELRQQTKSLGDTLVSKAPSAKQPRGEELNQKIDGEFAAAVTYFA